MSTFAAPSPRVLTFDDDIASSGQFALRGSDSALSAAIGPGAFPLEFGVAPWRQPRDRTARQARH